MSLKIADRVQETTNAAGTGSIALQGAVSGYRTFAASFTTGDVVPYCVTDGVDWETGTGTLTTGTPWTLSRDTVSASSNGGNHIAVTAGMKVFVDSIASLISGKADVASPSLTGLTTAQGLKLDTDGSAARGAYFTDEVTASISSSKITVDWTKGNNQVLVMNASLTGGVAFTAPSGVAKLTLRLIADGTDRGVAWTNTPDNIEFGDAAAPSLKYTSGYCNVICFLYDNHATTPKYYAVASTGFESATTA